MCMYYTSCMYCTEVRTYVACCLKPSVTCCTVHIVSLPHARSTRMHLPTVLCTFTQTSSPTSAVCSWPPLSCTWLRHWCDSTLAQWTRSGSQALRESQPCKPHRYKHHNSPSPPEIIQHKTKSIIHCRYNILYVRRSLRLYGSYTVCTVVLCAHTMRSSKVWLNIWWTFPPYVRVGSYSYCHVPQ